jgi:hypothetical protein
MRFHGVGILMPALSCSAGIMMIDAGAKRWKNVLWR